MESNFIILICILILLGDIHSVFVRTKRSDEGTHLVVPLEAKFVRTALLTCFAILLSMFVDYGLPAIMPNFAEEQYSKLRFITGLTLVLSNICLIINSIRFLTSKTGY